MTAVDSRHVVFSLPDDGQNWSEYSHISETVHPIQFVFAKDNFLGGILLKV